MLKILHLDNNQVWRERICRVLVEAGHQVVSVSNFDEFQKIWTESEGNFDIVICDASVHVKGDGFSLALELSSEGQNVICMTRAGKTLLFDGVLAILDKDHFEDKVLLHLVDSIGKSQV